jgi:hypothetical protein
MNVDRAVFVFAGCVVLIGIALSQAVNPWWLVLSAFAGVNMIQAAFTRFCPAAMLFKALGLPPGQAFPCSGTYSRSRSLAASATSKEP